MSMRSLDASAVLLVLVLGAGRAFAEGPNLGKPVNLTGIAAWDISVHPDGAGLPLAAARPLKAPRSMWRNARCATVRTGKAAPRAPLRSSVAVRLPTSRRR